MGKSKLLISEEIVSNNPNNLNKTTKEALLESIPSIHQCIICGTSIDDLEEDDFIQTQHGPLCKGCLDEKWFIKCHFCGEYEFESRVHYIDEKDYYVCDNCLPEVEFTDV